MKHVHHHTRIINEIVYLIVISYHHDGFVLVVDRLTVHPIAPGGLVGPNVNDTPDDINLVMYHDAIGWMKEDGLIA